jgi:hypothetical protein
MGITHHLRPTASCQVQVLGLAIHPSTASGVCGACGARHHCRGLDHAGKLAVWAPGVEWHRRAEGMLGWRTGRGGAGCDRGCIGRHGKGRQGVGQRRIEVGDEPMGSSGLRVRPHVRRDDAVQKVSTRNRVVIAAGACPLCIVERGARRRGPGVRSLAVGQER